MRRESDEAIIEKIVVIKLADAGDPSDAAGRTYRQVNAAKTHALPIGALVEIEDSGVRLFVVQHGRDCDMTPLYYLSAKKDDTEVLHPGFKNPGWVGGYSEESLRLIRLAAV